MVDRVEIVVVGGRGGDGIVSFRREKFVPFGGPDGGDGGKGGDIFILAVDNVNTLGWFRRRKQFRAGSGGRGGSNKKHGEKGSDLTLLVPVGTMIVTNEGEEKILVGDLRERGQRVLVAKGGRDGLGNTHFATATNQAPKVATKGEPGEERRLILELKLIADVGIIGYPNVGKSTLLTTVSKAKPKIGDYPFTTREPVLGVVEVDRKSFILAEIPGLIEGAHLGKGLGHDFLRHAERTKVLLHLLDGSSSTLIDDMNNLNKELALYSPTLAQKPQIVAVNKIDLPLVQERLSEIRYSLSFVKAPLFFVSAVTGQGLPQLIAKAAEMVERVNVEETTLEAPVAIFRPKPKGRRIR